MSINRWNKRRDETEPDIVEGLEKCGFQVRRQDFPDLLLRRAGRCYILEVEGITKNRKRSKKQLEFIRDWEIPIVKNLEDALAILGIVNGPNPKRLPTSVSCKSTHHGAPTSSVAAPSRRRYENPI